jgi:AcrR family transcriptional regulator
MEGVDAVSIAAIAHRTGIHESSIYRRWGTKENLALEALLAYSAQEIPLEDTGSLRGDLVALGRLVAAYLASPFGKALTRIAGSTVAEDPTISEARDTFWTQRFEVVLAIFDRAVKRGEFPVGADKSLALEIFLSPIHFRAWLGTPLSEADIEKIADFVIKACRAE